RRRGRSVPTVRNRESGTWNQKSQIRRWARRAPRTFAHPTSLRRVPSALGRLHVRAGRPAVAAAPVGHGLVELGPVLGVAQAVQEFLEFALILVYPAVRFGRVFAE